MSNVKIEGNASGTGTFTIAAPNSSTDRTLTLPDEAGTVLTSASDLPAANLTGSLPAGMGGSVLQTQVLVNTNRFTTTNTSYVGQGQTITVTPLSSTSTMVIFQTVQAYINNPSYESYISIDVNGVAAGSTSGLYQHQGSVWITSSFMYTYQPGTTSSQTYEIVMKVLGGTGYWGWTSSPASANNCRMVIMECEI
jgi:hypothetical protein